MTEILHNFFFDHYRQRRQWVSKKIYHSHNPTIGNACRLKIPAGTPCSAQELDNQITDGLRRNPEEFRMPVVLVDVGNFKMNFYAFSRAGINAVLHREGDVICIWRPRWLGMGFWLW
ncbi:MAG: hypothetical protein K0Q83_2323 [Deltaproteobacteria bacterium]|jgi:hypothetical protein|nr:hypothetical protein [Deltaproteobacteria bacterium]